MNQISTTDQPIRSYDYIIAGGGMAGLSMAYYLIIGTLQDKSILIIDRETKNINDRTWCFWEIGDNQFEEIIYRKWKTVRFQGVNYDQNLDIGDYRYKMLRGIDFYEFVLKKLKQKPNISFINANISEISGNEKHGIVITDKGEFFANNFVFDSTFRPKLDNPSHHNLLQHFKGIVIKTPQFFFDPAVPVMMNFQFDEPKDDCQFMYILPFDEQTALIEFTLFSEKLLLDEEYNFALKEYVEKKLQLIDYQVIESEFGVIPMSDYSFEVFPQSHIMRIGISGGFAKPSTGYTFARTQKKLQKLVKDLERFNTFELYREHEKQQKSTLYSRRFSVYDSLFLNVLQKKRYPAAQIFTQLYEANSATKIFSFLDEETTFWEEIEIMRTMPKSKFIAAALDIFWNKVIRSRKSF